MGQVKIYGLKATIDDHRKAISDVIHASLVEAFSLPKDKRFHRFIPLSKEDFIYPEDRSSSYLIIEISIFEGRSLASKKELIVLLYDRFDREVGIQKQDVEITLFETPKHNWGIRGVPGDELKLSYKVNV